MQDVTEIMHQIASQLSADQIANGHRKKGKTHVGPLLSGRRQTGHIFIIARRLHDFADRHNEERGDHEARAGVQQQE